MRSAISACATPKCSKARIERRSFCQECSENLARIRRELEEHPALLFNQRVAGMRIKKFPTCCFPGCFERRVPPEPFCYKGEDGH